MSEQTQSPPKGYVQTDSGVWIPEEHVPKPPSNPGNFPPVLRGIMCGDGQPKTQGPVQ